MLLRSLLVGAALCALLTGCASTYKATDYDRSSYTQVQETGGLQFSYFYNPLPGYYGKKARREDVSVVAVRVTNATDRPFAINRSTVRVQANDRPARLLSAVDVGNDVQQPVWPHLLWGLLWISYDGADADANPDVTLPVGLAIGVPNAAVAGGANGKAKRSFRDESLIGQTVGPGRTVEGLLFLRDQGSPRLSFEVVEPAAAP